MDDQYTDEVNRLKEQGLSQRKLASQLNISSEKVRDVLKFEAAGVHTMDEDKLRTIIFPLPSGHPLHGTNRGI